MVPISQTQVEQMSLSDDAIVREGEYIYYSNLLEPSHGASQRKLAAIGKVPSRL